MFRPCSPRIAGLIVAVCALAACDDRPQPAPGQALYERTVGGLACADCHGVAGRTPHRDWIVPGRTLAGVADRETLWKGRFRGDGAVEDALRLCAARFQYRMLGDVLEDVDHPAWDRVPLAPDAVAALAAYVRAFPGDPPEGRPPHRVDDVDRVLDLGGDPERGELLWKAACAVCHGSDAEGGLGPRLSGIDVVDPFSMADYVRQAAPDMDALSWMPYYPPSLLPAQDLADIVARYAE